MEDMPSFETSIGEAMQFKKEHGEFVSVVIDDANESCRVYFKKGARIFVPKALRSDRFVAGQLPTGWSAERYGIPKCIAERTDPITLYMLVALVEALISSGVEDAYEFFEYVHVSEVGNTTGSSSGTAQTLKSIFKRRFQDLDISKDIIEGELVPHMHFSHVI